MAALDTRVNLRIITEASGRGGPMCNRRMAVMHEEELRALAEQARELAGPIGTMGYDQKKRQAPLFCICPFTCNERRAPSATPAEKTGSVPARQRNRIVGEVSGDAVRREIGVLNFRGYPRSRGGVRSPLVSNRRRSIFHSGQKKRHAADSRRPEGRRRCVRPELEKPRFGEAQNFRAGNYAVI